MNHQNNTSPKWNIHKIVFELRSPMHIGWRKMANIQYTRYYVPARTVWGALTNAIVKQDKSLSFQEVGKDLKQNLRFSYFYFTQNADGSDPLIPEYRQKGLSFGRLTKNDFEREFLDSYAATAIQPESFSAEEASLHEVEIICAATKSEGKSVYLTGYVFEKTDSANLHDWQEAIKSLQLGGERKYGFGRVKGKVTGVKTDKIFGNYAVEFTSHEPVLKINHGDPLPAHVDTKSGLNDAIISGETEMLVSRETEVAEKFGQSISEAKLCFTPGTTFETELTIKFAENFIMEII